MFVNGKQFCKYIYQLFISPTLLQCNLSICYQPPYEMKYDIHMLGSTMHSWIFCDANFWFAIKEYLKLLQFAFAQYLQVTCLTKMPDMLMKLLQPIMLLLMIKLLSLAIWTRCNCVRAQYKHTPLCALSII